VTNLLFNARQILGRNRNPWIDYARGICILLVVYRHVFEGLTNVGVGSNSYPVLKYFNIFFFSFRMPLFFIVSGIFLGSSLLRKGVGGYINNRFQTIFYPLIIWGIVQVTLQLGFSDYVNAERFPIDYLNLVIDPRKIEQFWYLNALFFVSVLYAIMSWYVKFKPVQQLVTGLLFYAIASYCYARGIQIGFLQDILFFYVFFAIGDTVADMILNGSNYKLLSSYRTMLLLLPGFVALQHYFTKLNMLYSDDYYVQFHRPDLYIITALVGCAFVMNVSFVLQKLNIFRYLRVLGYHSLYIYVMHLMITAGIRVTMVRLLGIENIPAIMVVSIAGGVLLPIMFYNLADRAGAWWLFTLKRKQAPKQKEEKETALYFQRGLITPKESMAGKN
jgi:fucose 4-O-acetylase-like acetyltransferase